METLEIQVSKAGEIVNVDFLCRWWNFRQNGLNLPPAPLRLSSGSLDASTTKLGADVLIVKDILHSFERFETIIITPQIIKEAIDCSIINKLSFWDALIVTAAEGAKCEKLWSEDLNDGQVIRGVRIENPLKI